jgi:hypothetical protein
MFIIEDLKVEKGQYSYLDGNTRKIAESKQPLVDYLSSYFSSLPGVLRVQNNLASQIGSVDGVEMSRITMCISYDDFHKFEESLWFISRVMDSRYWAHGWQWEKSISIADTKHDSNNKEIKEFGPNGSYPTYLVIRSPDMELYYLKEHCRSLIQNIVWHLNHKPYISSFHKDDPLRLGAVKEVDSSPCYKCGNDNLNVCWWDQGRKSSKIHCDKCGFEVKMKESPDDLIEFWNNISNGSLGGKK